MKEITVISGKGGTGKTSLTAALAVAGSDLLICDCDVDAADLHLILNPEIKETHVFEGAWSATINPDKCTDCGICSDYCNFEAISLNEEHKRIINPFLCEGCRLCERLCPAGAITSSRSTVNQWFISDTRSGPMVHAVMGAGEENSGKLVTQVRKAGRQVANKLNRKYILNDGPPGTGCATIASVTGADAVLLILEPSITSLHDAERVIQLVQKFDIPIYALINKVSINPQLSKKIAGFLQRKRIELLGEIPFDKSMIEAMIRGQSINEYLPGSGTSKTIAHVWAQLTNDTGRSGDREADSSNQILPTHTD